MMELSKELNQRIEEAKRDNVWTEKLRAATTCEEFSKILAEKGIEAPVELQEVFATRHTGKHEKLDDNELEKVSGGFPIIFHCPKEYNGFLCELTGCPHRNQTDNTPDSKHYTLTCNLYHWKQVNEYISYKE